MASPKAKAFTVNNRERAIILFALEALKSNLDDEAQAYLADRFQATSGPDEDPHGAESVPSEVEENEIDMLIRRIEKHFGTGRIEMGQVELTPYEEWMVKSNLKTISEGANPAELIATLRRNGYPKIAKAVEMKLEELR